MPYDRKQLISRLDKLNLPKGKYVVLAGGAMLLHGEHLRKQTNDIDVSVNPAVFRDLYDKRHALRAKHYHSGYLHPEKLVIKGVHGDIEISGGGMSLIGRPPVAIEGHGVQSLKDILDFKRKLNRQKDHADIEILKAEIKRQAKLNPTSSYVKKDVQFDKRKTVRGGNFWTEDF